MENVMQFENKVLKHRWKLLKFIKGGSFGNVYTAIELSTNTYVAVKIEENKKMEKLTHESSIIRNLVSGEKSPVGIPSFIWVGTDQSMSDYTFMVTEHLGPSLEDLFMLCNKKFSLKTVLMIAEDCLNLLELVHSKSFIHRDVKPENFLIGLNSNSHMINLIDFGLSQRYKDPKTECHTGFRENKNLVGTARFLSINAHMGIEQSRRDDLESLGYMLIYFMNGSLPWQGIDSPNKHEKYQKIGAKKMKLPVELYCRSIPEEFSMYVNYCRSLIFEEKPDYNFLRKLFDQLFRASNFTRDYSYDWTNPLNINKEMLSKNNAFSYDVDEEAVARNSNARKMSDSVNNSVFDGNTSEVISLTPNKENTIIENEVSTEIVKPSNFKKKKIGDIGLVQRVSSNLVELNSENQALLLLNDVTKPTAFQTKNETFNSEESKETVN